MTKRLYRSTTEKMLGGVAGGLADYLDIDVTLVRLLWLVAALAGFGIPAYLIAWIIIPVNPDHSMLSQGVEADYVHEGQVDQEKPAHNGSKKQKLVGIVLITIGAIYILNQILPWFRFGKMWPVLFIIFGVAILLNSKDGGKP